MSNSAYFISIINDMSNKNKIIIWTRNDEYIYESLFFETILGAFLVYVPVSNTVTGTRPLRFTWWTAAFPFSLAIYIYDELRKRKLCGYGKYDDDTIGYLFCLCVIVNYF